MTMHTGKLRPIKAVLADPTNRYVHPLASMGEAIDLYRRSWELEPAGRAKMAHALATMPPAMIGGHAGSLPAILAAAETLADAATALDPRLLGTPGWVRVEEGVALDAGAYLAGEERCMFARRRARRTDRQASGQPVRLVVSTDTIQTSPAAAAAFIAAAKLAAQFQPLEIWWQGSWVRPSGWNQGCGHVFHVPVVQAGSLDFSRLQFILCDPARDHVSSRIVLALGIASGKGWGKGTVEFSLLPDTRDFIPASGLRASAESVAQRAARWAGLDPLWLEQYEASRTTAQEWTPTDNKTGGDDGDDNAETPAQKRARLAADKREQKQADRNARERRQQIARERGSSSL